MAQLREACQIPHVSDSFQILDVKLSVCDLLLTSPCVGVFFAIGTSESVMLDLWHIAEQEIADFKEKPKKPLPRDLVLTIVLPEVAYDRETALTVVADPYVCRKFVLPANGMPLSTTLQDLPFWPTDEFAEESRRVRIRGVDHALASSGFDEQLIDDLRDLGVEGIADKLSQRVYSIPTSAGDEPISFSETPDRKISLPATVGTRVAALEVKDFRGIRTLGGPLSLDGAVVFFYGPNGVGKTSIVDALEFTASGAVARLHHDPDSEIKSTDPLINLFSNNNQASVSVTLSSGATITRYVDAGYSVSTNLNGSFAKESDVARIIVGGEISEDLDPRLIPDLIRHSHFLGQHSIREFISGGSSREDPSIERFKVVSKLFGKEDYVRRTEKIRRLIKELQSRSSDLSEELGSEREKLRSLENRINERKALIAERQTKSQSSKEIFSAVESLNKKLESLGVRVLSMPAATASLSEVSTYLTGVETHLGARKTTLEDSLINLESLKRECAARGIRNSRLSAISKKLSEQLKEIDGYDITVQQAAKTLSDRQNDVMAAQAQKEQLREELDRVQMLITNGPLYLAARKRVEVESENLETLGKRLELIRENTRRFNEEIKRFERELSKSEAELKAMELRRDRIREFDRELESLLVAVSNQSRLIGQLKMLSQQVEEPSRRLQKDSNELSQIETEITNIDLELRSVDDENQRRNKLISEILRYADSRICPLCGHDHDTETQLRSEIKKQLDRIPEPIIRLAAKKEELLNRRTELKKIVQKAHEDIALLDHQKTGLDQDSKQITAYLKKWRQLAIDLRLLDSESDFESFVQAKPVLTQHEHTTLHQGVEELRQTIGRRYAELDQSAKSEDQTRSQIQKSQYLLRDYSSHVDNLKNLPGFQGLSDYDEAETLRQQTSITERLKAATDKTSEAARLVELAATSHRKAEEAVRVVRSDHAKLLVEQKTLALEEDSLKVRLAAEKLSQQADESEVATRIFRIQTSLIRIKDGEEERNQLHQAVTIENLRLDLQADEDDLNKQSASLKPLEGRITLFQAWHEQLTNTVSLIGSEQRERIEEQIEELEPTLNKIWKRLSPHPLFDEVRLEVRKKGRDNALRILVTVNGSTVELGNESGTVTPTSYFSEGQLNVLALSVFLAISIRQVWSGFKLVAIDDPVQQMDDFNANAFFDLIRGLSQSGRQFIIASCDLHLYRMALEKFACLNTTRETRFLAYRLKGAGKAGPEIIADTPVAQNL